MVHVNVYAADICYINQSMWHHISVRLTEQHAHDQTWIFSQFTRKSWHAIGWHIYWNNDVVTMGTAVNQLIRKSTWPRLSDECVEPNQTLTCWTRPPKNIVLATIMVISSWASWKTLEVFCTSSGLVGLTFGLRFGRCFHWAFLMSPGPKVTPVRY